ncbi:MAG: DUF1854 domain-containing protein [Gallionellaceae bacterium]
MHNFQLHRNAKGRLVLTDAEGVLHESIVPVHAFPITAPELGVALVDAEGHELVWLDNLSDLTADIRALVLEELASREFIPEILSIKKVSTFATPSVWEVETDRGTTSFILKVEEDIRRLNHTALLIAGSQGIHFLIRNIEKMDKNTRRILDRFL